MSRRIIGKGAPSVKKGVYDLQEAYQNNLENKWSNYTDITITAGSAAAQWDTPDGFRTQIFTGPASFTINSSGDRSGIEYVVIGGGGGGGTGIGGGGGAGHVKFGRRDVSNGNCRIAVGAGGAQSLSPGGPTGSTSSPPRASFNGSNSSLLIPAITITSSGGGAGGSSTWTVTGAQAGASGGGGSLQCCPAQGSAGGPGGPDGAGYGGYGSYTIPGNGSGGGGGGAGSGGSPSQDTVYTYDGFVTKGGDGGLGVVNTFNDSFNGPFGKWMPIDIRNTYFSEEGFVGGGGGGGCSQPGGAYAPRYVGGGKAKHGGGNGALGFANGVAGRQYSGGGGGGGGQTDSPYRFGSGGAGGSGVVMLRYRFKPNEADQIVPLASGGIINLNAGDGYVYHTFTSTGFFEVLVDDLECEVLVVGGGGAAGGGASAGGGAGGVVYDTSLKLKRGNYGSVIGSGGAAPYAYTPQAVATKQGNTTSFADIKAFGGGGGAHVVATNDGYGLTYTSYVGQWGGSGGGRLDYIAPPAPLSSRGSWQEQTNNPPTRFHYGNPGGYSLNTSATFPALFNTQYAAGGGGGAGGAGSNGPSSPTGLGGKGGNGVSVAAFPYSRSSVNPDGITSQYYGGGGAGYSPPAAPGDPGRSPGGGGSRYQVNGTQNLGGGGAQGGGLGGSGVVIIRYKVNSPDVPTNHF